MKTDRWLEVREHLDAVLDLDFKSRAAYLQRLCAEDESLRTEIEGFLAQEDEVGCFMEKPVVDLISGRSIPIRRALKRAKVS